MSSSGRPERATGWRQTLANLRSIGGAVLLALVIRVGLFESFEIDGPSMEPSLLNGERLVVGKYAFGLFLPFREQAELTWGTPRPGDVVVLKSPADGVTIIKRVIGVPGDTIEVHDDIVYRNGHALPRRDLGHCLTGGGASLANCHWYESEVDGRTFRTSSAGRDFEGARLTVPEGHVYVLGDHRDMSNDSRNPLLGPVPLSRLKGKALAVYWSRGEEGLRTDRMFKNVQ